MALEATQIRRRRLVRDKLPGTHVTTGRTPAFAFCSLWSSESDILISMWGGMSRHGVPKRCLSPLGVGPIMMTEQLTVPEGAIVIRWDIHGTNGHQGC